MITMNFKKKLVLASVLSVSVLLTGCQTSQGLYNWGNYEGSLYEHYKNPGEQEVFAGKMLESIEKAGTKVPPGMYAEYGTLLLQNGKTDEAVVYFEKEKALWPESQHLMDTMINALSSGKEQKTEKTEKTEKDNKDVL